MKKKQRDPMAGYAVLLDHIFGWDRDQITGSNMFVQMTVMRSISQMLTNREALAVVQYLGLNGNPPLSYAKLGVVLGGVTRERARQIYAKALRKLRRDSDCFKVLFAPPELFALDFRTARYLAVAATFICAELRGDDLHKDPNGWEKDRVRAEANRVFQAETAALVQRADEERRRWWSRWPDIPWREKREMAMQHEPERFGWDRS